jgi:hypothetical protein
VPVTCKRWLCVCLDDVLALCCVPELMTHRSVILMTSESVRNAQLEARSLLGFYGVRALLCSVSVCVLSLTV